MSSPVPPDPTALPDATGLPVVRVRATFTPGQLVRAGLEANRPMAVVTVLALVLGVAELAIGDLGTGLPGVLVAALLGYLMLVAPRKQIERGGDQVDWTVDAGGLRLRTRVSDVGVAWSQVQRLTGQPNLLLFRVRPTRFVLPRRCLHPQDAATIAALARNAGVDVQGAV